PQPLSCSVAWLPSSMLILLIFLSTPIDSNRSRPRADYPWFSAKKLGPQRTIAKENGERKEKSQKRREKCGFFWMGVEIAAKTAAPSVSTRAGGGAGMEESGGQPPHSKLGAADRVARSA